MNQPTLKIGFGDYDRTRLLADGTIKMDGINATFTKARIVTEIFEGMAQERTFDVAELGMSYFLRMMDIENPPFLALPIFPNRCFRHSAVYINQSSGIKRPKDLNGKRIGEFAMYGHDAGVWPKGILSDEYGFKPETCKWVIGGLDWPMKPVNFVPLIEPPGIEIHTTAPGTDLGALLEAGEIDALMTADLPKCFLDRSPKVGRLFPDFKKVEQDYFKRTGIYPMMHTVVVKKELATQSELLRSVYKGFCDAEDALKAQYRRGMIFNNMATMLPWINDLVEQDVLTMGDDWWPSGLAANRKAVDTFLRYHFEQGLSKRPLRCEDIFVPEFLAL